jgi:dihydrofolate reductase
MRKLIVFNNTSLDGYFTGLDGDMSFAHNVNPDREWDDFILGNASGESTLLFGRITYELMESYWPTPFAAEQMPEMAERMNRAAKVVFSRSLDHVSWSHTRLAKGDLITEVRRLKAGEGDHLVILGSGNIVTQLAPSGLIDEYQLVVVPVVLGAGRTLFEGIETKLELKLTMSRGFANGNVFLSYESLTKDQT